MNRREFFNSMAEKWDSIVCHDEGKIRKILDMAQIGEGFKVLDVGTGTGVMIQYLHSLAGADGRIVAVDLAEKMIEVAKSKYNFGNIEFISGDVLKVDLPENYFDCVMCYSMFPHFEDKKAAVSRLARYLKKGGKFVICHSQSREAINNLHKSSTEAIREDSLPPAEIIMEYYEQASLRTSALVDNSDMFVVIGVKE